MLSKLLLLLLCFAPTTTLASSCPSGKFFATYTRTSCSMWAKDTVSNHTAVGTRGEMLSMSTATNTVCELLVAPNASLGTTNSFNVKVDSIRLSADSSMSLVACHPTIGCDTVLTLSSVEWSQSRSFTVNAPAMKIILRSGPNPPTSQASNTFYLFWDSGLTLPCLDCANLVPTPTGNNNWLFNNAPGIGCDWKCAPGYYIPITGPIDAYTGAFLTKGPLGCVPCTLCSAGTFTNPFQYDGGCWGYVGNAGAYGAVVNSRDSSCKQCSSCAPSVSQACSQLSDTVCAVGVRTVAKPMISFK